MTQLLDDEGNILDHPALIRWLKEKLEDQQAMAATLAEKYEKETDERVKAVGITAVCELLQAEGLTLTSILVAQASASLVRLEERAGAIIKHLDAAAKLIN